MEHVGEAAVVREFHQLLPVEHLPKPGPRPTANWPCDRTIKPTPPFPGREAIGYVEKHG